MPDAAPRRHGAFTVIPGPVPVLAVGDVYERHVVLSADSLTLYSGERPHDTVAWSQVDAAAVRLPRVRLVSPRVGDALGALIAAYLGPGTAPSMTGRMRVRLHDGTPREWQIDGHHAWGYRPGDVIRADRLLAHLTAVPASRLLLADPDEVLALLARPAARR